jgi:hypothetical protein
VQVLLACTVHILAVTANTQREWRKPIIDRHQEALKGCPTTCQSSQAKERDRMAALQVRLGALSAAAAADAFSVGEPGLLLAALSSARPQGRSAWRYCRASLRRTLASDAFLGCVGGCGRRTPSIGEGAGRRESGAAGKTNGPWAFGSRRSVQGTWANPQSDGPRRELPRSNGWQVNGRRDLIQWPDTWQNNKLGSLVQISPSKALFRF